MFRDRILRAARCEPVDTTPVWFMRQVGRYLPEYRALRSRYSMQEILQTPELAAEATWMPLRRFDVDAAILFSDLLVPLWGMGVEFDLVEGKGPVVRTSADRWANLPPMDLERVAFTFEAIHLLRRTLDRPLIGFTGAPFTVAAYLIEGQASRDWPRTRAFLHTHPEAWHALLRQLAAGLGAYLRAQVDAGVQMVQVFDSWVGVLSPVDFVRGYCCGGGGGGMWLDSFSRDYTRERLSDRRVREAVETGADVLAVCCPYEVSRFEDSVKATGNDGKLVVKDIIELVDEALGSPRVQ